MTDSKLIKGQQAYEKILRNESYFTGLCDEIYHEDGSVCFRREGYVYKLWHYSVLNGSIWEIKHAVQMWMDGYERDKKLAIEEKEREAQRIEDERNRQLTEVKVAYVENQHDYVAWVGLAIMLFGAVTAFMIVIL